MRQAGVVTLSAAAGIYALAAMSFSFEEPTPLPRIEDMTEQQIDALVQYIRIEAYFAEKRARGESPSPADEREAVIEFKEAMRDSDQR